jgi:single-strand selective monofunctional uracil DNA glycosylase
MAGAKTPLVRAAERLRAQTAALTFAPPVAYVYRPLDYAWPVVRRYLETFGTGPKEILLVGMNPGPFGMGQTGVPFGEVALVRDWMKLEGKIASPPHEDIHPKRPVLGFACPRSEVSGRRLWGAIAARYPDARDFFARGFAVNYCPLLFLDEAGRNLTPDKLPRAERAPLEAACDEHLAEVARALTPATFVGVGQYAVKCLERVVGKKGHRIVGIPHPSPASPAANKGWEKLARGAFERAGVPSILG